MNKLHLVCGKDDYRPTLNYVKATKHNVVATDGHCLAVIPTSEIFDEEFIEGIPDTGVLIHHEDWKKMISYQFVSWKIPGQIIKTSGKKRGILIEVEMENEGDLKNYPNWDAVVPTGKNVGIPEIGINFKTGQRLQEALNFNACHLQFKGNGKPIKITGAKEQDSKRFGILMPCMI